MTAEMPLVPPWSIPLCQVPHCRMNPVFAASSSLFSGTVTAHVSCSGSAIVGFSCCSHATPSTSSRSFIPSSSIILLTATTQQSSSPTRLLCCCFSICLLFSPLPLPSSFSRHPFLNLNFQTHQLFLSCFNLLTQVHLLPNITCKI